MKPIVHSETLRVKVTPEMMEAFKEYAYFNEEATMSQIIRREIKRILEAAQSNSN